MYIPIEEIDWLDVCISLPFSDLGKMGLVRHIGTCGMVSMDNCRYSIFHDCEPRLTEQRNMDQDEASRYLELRW